MSLAESLARIAPTFTGQLLQPLDPGYDEARHVHNGLVDKRPALIARCLGVADVVDAVKLARSRQARNRRPRRRPQRRGPGHDRRRHHDRSLADERHSRRPPAHDRARAGRRALEGIQSRDAAPRSRDDRRRRRHDRHRRPDARRRPGLADAEVRPRARQPALGRTRSWPTDGSCTPARTRTPDLFWAIRGGGGNFGIATSLEYSAAPGRPDHHRRPRGAPASEGVGRAASSSATSARRFRTR